MRAEPILRTLYKQCKCVSSSSGPRFVVESAEPTTLHKQWWRDTVSVTVRLVEFACDSCNTEWRDMRELHERKE